MQTITVPSKKVEEIIVKLGILEKEVGFIKRKLFEEDAPYRSSRGKK